MYTKKTHLIRLYKSIVVGGINGKSNPKYSPFTSMHFGDILSTWEMHLDIVFRH